MLPAAAVVLLLLPMLFGSVAFKVWMEIVCCGKSSSLSLVVYLQYTKWERWESDDEDRKTTKGRAKEEWNGTTDNNTGNRRDSFGMKFWLNTGSLHRSFREDPWSILEKLIF